MSRRVLSRAARGLAIAGLVLIVAALYPTAWADLDETPLLLAGLTAAYLTAITGRKASR